MQKSLILTHFWFIFPILGANKILKNLALSHTISYGFLATPRKNFWYNLGFEIKTSYAQVYLDLQ